MAYTNIDDPSAYFQTALYAGNGTGQTITNDGNSDLKPDFLWFKNRSETVSHTLWDSTRGITKFLVSDSTASEYTNVSGYELTSFNTDGFGLGAHNNAGINQSSSYNYVGWQWKANGGTTASNSDGSITSTVQVNQDAGFSIVTYTGTGSSATFGHGLSKAPEISFYKIRSQAYQWMVYTGNIASTTTLVLNGTDTGYNSGGTWGTHGASTFALLTNADVNGSGQTYVSYHFHSVDGYSKVGTYTGNDNADGTFVYCGFKPAFVLIQNIVTSGEGFVMFNNKSDPTNVVGTYLTAYGSTAEQGTAGTTSSRSMDFTSNGFKLRGNSTEINDGEIHIFYAVAETPFKYSNAR